MPWFATTTIKGRRISAAAIHCAAAFSIILYGRLLRARGWRDPLEKKVVDHPSAPGFDGWATLHFFYFGLLGYLFPRRHVQALGVSLGWELIEHLLGTTDVRIGGKRLQLVGDQDEEGRPTGKEDAWWYGRFVTDNSFNMSGYILGSALADKMQERRALKGRSPLQTPPRETQ